MLIIAIGFGFLTDPFTCSCEAKRSKVDPHSMEEVLKRMIKAQKLRKEWIDELIVIENDKVIASYNSEDGLGPC